MSLHSSTPLGQAAALCHSGSSSTQPPALASSTSRRLAQGARSSRRQSSCGSTGLTRQGRGLAVRAHASQQGQAVAVVPGPAVMTDETVPEGHQGLHGFLYGESGADVHDAGKDDYRLREGEDDGAVLLDVAEFTASRQGHKLAGVYAVYDQQRSLQYVGYSRNMALSVKGHSSNPKTADLTAWVRAKVFRDPSMVTRSRLDEERLCWMAELCESDGLGATKAAPGNTEGLLHFWEGRSGPSHGAIAGVAMTDAERTAYEEKKLKLRKAMGENLHDDVEGETMDSRQRRLALLQAVEGDDWSSVIDLQTQQTSNGAAAAAAGTVAAEPASAATGAADVITSPFAPGQSGNAPEVVEEKREEEAMSVESVDRALEEVRPYLIADGGDVAVVSVQDGVVELMLQGACGTCPSATTTMKMGIERVLQEKFSSQLREVREVGGALAAGMPSRPTVKLVDAHLDMLRPAIHNFKGSVEVLSVDNTAGVCVVKYQGPAPVGMGIQAAIKDKFPGIKTVTLVAPEE